jgi:prepilin-type N-terminal cleavage/methylation domain-containing protein
MKKKNGFTLIELLAVIIILSILLIIAIPAVTNYINLSRKNAYIDTAKEIISGARSLVNSGSMNMYDANTTYYIDAQCIKTEGDIRSPYGVFDKAYVVVAYNGTGYHYYWVSRDIAGHGIKDVTYFDDLDVEDIESDIKAEEITTKVGVGKRTDIIVFNNSCKPGPVQQAVSKVGEPGVDPVEYPEGKTKVSVRVGDIVKILDEEFYVVQPAATMNDDLVLLAKYNLKIGHICSSDFSVIGEIKKTEDRYGIQDSNMIGYHYTFDKYYGTIEFANSKYWDSGVGSTYPGSYSDPNYPYVFDDNSTIYDYLSLYRKYVERLGAKVVDVRLLTYKEAVRLGCNYPNLLCTGNSFLYETSFWLGNAYDYFHVWRIYSNRNFDHIDRNYKYHFGIRPVVVI